MLDSLTRSYKSIDQIAHELSQIFTGVDLDTLKNDAVEFFDELAADGFLYRADSLPDDLDPPALSSECTLTVRSSQKGDLSSSSSSTIQSVNFLKSIHFEIASACNERCVHCYIPNACKSSFMDPQLFDQIIEEGKNMNIIHVTLSGGEPLLHPDILHFLQKCRELDLAVNVLSNLTLLSDELLEEMRKNPFLCVQASLYSMNPQTHDQITHLQGSFEKTLCSIERLCEVGIPVQISCPLFKQNKDSWKDVVNWGAEHQIPVVLEPAIFAAYDHSGCNVQYRLSLDEIEKVWQEQIRMGMGHDLYEDAQKKEELTEDHSVCSICRYDFCVSANGKAFPCAGWQNHIIGDLRNQSVEFIWSKAEEAKELRMIKRASFPKCKDCKDRGYCTICMMWNSNENPDGDPFKISPFRCKMAARIHQLVNNYRNNCTLKEN